MSWLEQQQREYAQDVADGVLPAPGDQFSGEAAVSGTSGRVVVRYLTQTAALTVWVHFRYVDEPGSFAGNGEEQLEEFRRKFPVKLASADPDE